MKQLSDGTQVSSITYYFLLEWNDRDNWHYIIENFNKRSLHQLNIKEYYQLAAHAFETEINKLKVIESQSTTGTAG